MVQPLAKADHIHRSRLVRARLLGVDLGSQEMHEILGIVLDGLVVLVFESFVCFLCYFLLLADFAGNLALNRRLQRGVSRKIS